MDVIPAVHYFFSVLISNSSCSSFKGFLITYTNERLLKSVDSSISIL